MSNVRMYRSHAARIFLWLMPGVKGFSSEFGRVWRLGAPVFRELGMIGMENGKNFHWNIGDPSLYRFEPFTEERRSAMVALGGRVLPPKMMWACLPSGGGRQGGTPHLFRRSSCTQ